MLYELNEALECIIPFLYHLALIVVENSLVVLCLVNRTLVEVEWQIPLARFKTFIPWFEIGMLRTRIADRMA
jgi:hypothetical protein